MPGVKAFGLVLSFEVGASQPKIIGFLNRVGLQVSKGNLSDLLIEDQDVFHAESDGLRSTSYQQTDSTLRRVKGQKQNCHIVCTFYTVYRTLPQKDRLSVLGVLRSGRPRRFRLNQTGLDGLANVQLSQATRQTLTAC